MTRIFDMRDTWTDASTDYAAIRMDAADVASTDDTLLLDLKVDGNSKFSVRKDGAITVGGGPAAGMLNVRDFGCYGDGIHDDTEAFQAAIHYLIGLRRGTQYGYGTRLRVPYGTYLISRLEGWLETSPGVFAPMMLVMEGDGIVNTIIRFTDEFVGFELGNCQFNISNIGFQAPGAGYGVGATQSMIVMGLLDNNSGTGVYGSVFSQCSFGGGHTAVAMQGTGHGRVAGCCSEIMFSGCVFGFTYRGAFINHYNALDFTFLNCSSQQCEYMLYNGGAGGEIQVYGGSHSNNTVSFLCQSNAGFTVIGTRLEGGDIAVVCEGVGPHMNLINLLVSNAGPSGMGIKHTAGELYMQGCLLQGHGVHTRGGTLIMRQCSVNDDVPFHAILEGGDTSTYYSIEGCRSVSSTFLDVVFPDETGVLRGGNNKIPFSFSNWRYASIVDQTTQGHQFSGFNGQVLYTNVVNADPNYAGQMWNDAGTVKISEGNAWSQLKKASGIKLANTNLPLMVATYQGQVASDDYAAVLGTLGKATGKWYFEVKLVADGGTNAFGPQIGGGVGVALGTFAVDGAGAGFPGFTGSCGLMSDSPNAGATTGDIHINQATWAAPTHSNVAGLGYEEGDVVQVSFDKDLDLIWFALNNTGTWNGGAGTPQAGTGGFSIAAIAGTIYPMVSIYKSNGYHALGGTQQESLCWQAYFHANNYAPPSGFNSLVPATGTLSANTLAPSVYPAMVAANRANPILTCTTGSWDAVPLSFTYQWMRDGVNIHGALSSTYIALTSDAGHTFTCKVACINAFGTSQYTTATGSTSVGLVPDAILADRPTVTPETCLVGDVVSMSYLGGWDNSPTSYAYQWFYPGVANISGATLATYTTVAGDLTKFVDCRIEAINAFGSGGYAWGINQCYVGDGITGPPPANTVPPLVSPTTAVVGTVLSTDNGTWQFSPTSFTYKWFQYGIAFIPGATASTYTTTTEDIGKNIRVDVIAHNAYGSTTLASSNGCDVTAF